MMDLYKKRKEKKILNIIKRQAAFRQLGRLFFYTAFLALLPFIGSSQISITTNSDAQALTQLLSGAGVSISNYVKTCDNNATGTFNNVNSNLGISQGVILSTGRVTSIPQGVFNVASGQFTNSVDPQLSTLTAGAIFDKCILEFDIVPQGSVLKFDYVFASEEYPEFVCSNYNDVFGFFISGPNPGGGNYANLNMATIPNSNDPVCINSVNPGVPGTYQGSTWNPAGCVSLGNTSYFIDNRVIANPHNVYDGMTKVMTAKADVIPCQTYHLKIAISDVGDRIYDSGVFLQAYSFTSTPYSVSITPSYSYPGYTSSYEGCVNGMFTVSISSAQQSNVTINLVIGGTATNGTDYNTIPTTVVIPAGQTSVTIPVTVIQDNIAEGNETVILSYTDLCTGLPQTSGTLNIQDSPVSSLTVGDSTLCAGQSTHLIASGAATYSWSPATGLSSTSVANPTATPSSTTTYTVTMTAGSCVQTSSRTIYVSTPSVSITSNPSGVVCNNASIQLTANASGGVNPVSYSWNNGANTNSTTITNSGTYSVTTTDSYGCTATASVAKTISNLNVSGTVTNVSCNGGNNGSINLNVTGSNSPFTYNWGGGITTQNRTNLSSGLYSVTVTNSAGCTATASFSITQPASALNTSAILSNVTCNGAGNGSINLTVTGGFTPYTFLWSNGSTAEDISNLSVGTFTVTVTDGNNCTATRTATITQPVALSVTTTSTNVNCFGGNNGSIQLTANGGTGSYTYIWSNAATSQNLNNLTSGSYSVTIQDANGCSAVRSVTITQPSALTVQASASAPSCSGSSSGTISTTVSGGTSSYTYLWNNGATSQNLTNAAAGTYTVTVTDSKNCTATSSTTLNLSSAIGINATINPVTCFGFNNGSITLSINGGSSPYSFNWGGGITTQNRTGLVGGNYTVTVTDAASCSATATYSVSQPSSGLSATAQTTHVSCFGTSTGSISLNVIGGTSPYTYNWGGAITTQNRNNIPAGSYTVTITDAASCSATATANITQPTVLNVSNTVTNVSCFGGNNGAMNLTITGGTSPYQYSWTGTGATTQNAINLPAGSYSVTVTDAKSCTASSSGTVTQPAILTVSLTNSTVNCANNNGIVTTNVIGGTASYTYLWNTGATTQNLTGVGAGTYIVTITDSKSCSATGSATLVNTAAPVLSATVNDVTCFGSNNGSITLSVSGGLTPYTFNWGGGVTTQNRTGLVGGNYTVTVTDADSCSATATYSVSQPSSGLSATAQTTHVSCFGTSTGSISLNVNGGTSPYTYNWGGGITTQNRNNIPAGTYQVTVADANSCVTTLSAPVTQPIAALTVTANGTNISCYGYHNGTAIANASGGTSPYTYLWTGNSTSASLNNLSVGTYTVTATDANGCTANASLTIQQPAVFTATIQPINVSCFGGNNGVVTAHTSGGNAPYSYLWNDGSTNFSKINVTADSYTITITDAQSCQATASAQVTQPAQTIINPTITHVTCYAANTGSIQLQVTGGIAPYQFIWSDGASAQNKNHLAAGTYSVTATDAQNCSTSSSIQINQPAAAIEITSSVRNVTCYGWNNGSATATVTGGTSPYNYSWNNGVTLNHITNTQAGLYTLTVTDNKSCTATHSVNIAQPASPLSANVNVTHITCYNKADGRGQVNASGGTSPYTYTWQDGTGNSLNQKLSPGIHTVTVSDANLCSITASASVTQPPPITVTHQKTDVTCYGNNDGRVQVIANGGTMPYNYTWSNYLIEPNISNLSSGTYTVTIYDANLCSSTFSVSINQPQEINISSQLVHVPCHGGSTGSIKTNVTGGNAPYRYSWNNQSMTADITNLSAGTYSVTVLDSKNCTSQSSFQINEATPILINETIEHPVCAEATGKIFVTASGGTSPYQYHWNNEVNSKDLYGLKSGNYKLTVQDANGCIANKMFEVTHTDEFRVEASGGGTIKIGESTELNAETTGSSYTILSWAPSQSLSCDNCSQTIANPIQNTLYTVTALDTNGCQASDTVSVIVIDDFTLFVPNAFTPNGDGNNDLLQLYGNLESIRTVRMMIFDRWGEKVFESDDAHFAWDGNYRGVTLAPGIYTYMLKVVRINGRSEEPIQGSITLLK